MRIAPQVTILKMFLTMPRSVLPGRTGLPTGAKKAPSLSPVPMKTGVIVRQLSSI